MDLELARFLEASRRESTLEGAAARLLERVIGLAVEQLGEGVVCAAWVQVSAGHPFVVAHPPLSPPVTGLAELGPAFWALIRERAAPLGVDLRRLRVLAGPTDAGSDWRPEPRPPPELGQLVLVPLWTPGPRLDGALGLALAGASRVALERAWSTLTRALGAYADLFGPMTALLPRRAPPVVEERGPWLPVVGRAMAPVITTLDAYARMDEILLLRGPTGTGKSRLASWCWQRSPRAGGRFVVANLHGVPESGQESELFGVRKGTFTGVGERTGQIQAAQSGTLFLDEIDKLSLAAQVKLLRLLDERRFRVLGDPGDREADVRFIIASNADLEALVASGRFLEDLYYRINVLPVRIPALAQRRDEIGPWSLYLARTLHQGRVGNDAVELSPLAVDFLVSQPWPGNLRQLHNVVRRAYALAAMDGLAGLSEGELPGEVLIGRPHVERGLGEEPGPGAGEDGAGSELLRRAALGVVRLAERRRAAGLPPLSDRDGDLELADAFRGLVLKLAVERTGDVRKAFALFGLEGRLRGGNHLRTWRQAADQLALLERLLAEDARAAAPAAPDAPASRRG